MIASGDGITPVPIAPGTFTVAVSYTNGGRTFTASFPLNMVSEYYDITPPSKTAYEVGETLDYTGLSVTRYSSDGTSANITANCTLSPAAGTTVTEPGDMMISVSYNGATLGTFRVAVASVAVTTPPDKTDYTQGDTLDYTGLVITATLPDGTTQDITSDCTFTPPDGAEVTATGPLTVTVEYDGETVTTFEVEVAGEGVVVTVVGEAL